MLVRHESQRCPKSSQSLVHVCMPAMLLQSCLTLCDFMNCSPPGSSVHGILQARILGWVAMYFNRGSFQPKGIKIASPALQAHSLQLSHWGSLWSLHSTLKLFEDKDQIQKFCCVLQYTVYTYWDFKIGLLLGDQLFRFLGVMVVR